MQEGGAHSVTLEGGERIESTVARIVEAGIPVMGHIGQVQVCHDLSGAFTGFVPKYVKRSATLADTTQVAFTQYLGDVRQGLFPTKAHSISMDESVIASLETPQ